MDTALHIFPDQHLPFQTITLLSSRVCDAPNEKNKTKQTHNILNPTVTHNWKNLFHYLADVPKYNTLTYRLHLEI